MQFGGKALAQHAKSSISARQIIVIIKLSKKFQFFFYTHHMGKKLKETSQVDKEHQKYVQRFIFLCIHVHMWPHDCLVATGARRGRQIPWNQSCLEQVLVTTVASLQSVHHFFTEVYTERLEKGNLPDMLKMQASSDPEFYIDEFVHRNIQWLVTNSISL